MPILKVAVLYGGKSTEHEVSVHSAQTVCRVLSEKKINTKFIPFYQQAGPLVLAKGLRPATPNR